MTLTGLNNTIKATYDLRVDNTDLMTPSVTFVLGTRPEIIKLSPIIQECNAREVSFSLVHTGQHYSEELDEVFFDQLRLPPPDANLGVGSSPHGRQTGKMIAEVETFLQEYPSDILIVQGDTNSVLAGGIAASKLQAPLIGHVEAGLRSHDMDMPEEINRRLVDHVSDYLFAPTDQARENLLAEDISPDQITVTGNTIVDAVEHHITVARDQRDTLVKLNLEEPFGVLTAHRAENVDDRERFASLLHGVGAAARALDVPIVYPIHPRAKSRLSEFELEVPPEIHLIEPLDFLDFLVLEDSARIVFTDSGGVQEESCILGTPCVTLRDRTERPETVNVGANRIVGVDPETIVDGAEKVLQGNSDWTNPFGDGTAAKQILNELEMHEC